MIEQLERRPGLAAAPAAAEPAPRAADAAAFPAAAAPAPSLAHTCLATVATWTSVALLQALAIHRDKLGQDGTVRFVDVLAGFVPQGLAVAAVSCLLAAAFHYRADAMLRPRAMAACLAAMLALFLPLQAAAGVVFQLAWSGANDTGFAALWQARDAFGWWVDACLAVFAYLAQAALAAWRRGQAEALAWQQAQDEGMELRLRLLQGQLKPHFLFNALNSISALVRTADRELAARALAQLSDLLRYAVHSSRHEWLSVADEMAFIDDYLDLQLLRYGERLAIDLAADAAPWARLACPPLLFQPLVENAIHHGVERHHGQCTIRIRLALDGGTIRLSVANPTPAGEAGRQGHGIGLQATAERLAILYPGQARLLAEAGPVNFDATLAFPARPFHDN